jgi:hypothetical protein
LTFRQPGAPDLDRLAATDVEPQPLQKRARRLMRKRSGLVLAVILSAQEHLIDRGATNIEPENGSRKRARPCATSR